MKNIRRALGIVLAILLAFTTMLGNISAKAASKQIVLPQVQFADAPRTQYILGDRVNFNIYSPNYGGRVEYRVILWNDAQKTYYDLWNSSNGYPSRYYTKWKPYGNNIFTLGWIINEPGTYRITVSVKRAGISSQLAALKGMNCDSYTNSVAFTVKKKEVVIDSIEPLGDVIVNQGSIPVLPTTAKANMSDGTQKDVRVNWGTIDTSKLGLVILEGSVEGTTKKAVVRLIVNQGTLNVYSIEAVSTTKININLRESINSIPVVDRFTLKDSYNTAVRIKTLTMSSDKKTIYLATDYMTPGRVYALTIDGVYSRFTAPYNNSENNGYSVSVYANDRVVEVGKYIDSYVITNPSDATVRYTSYNESIARVDYNTGKIRGISSGTTTIAVTASRTGYVSGTATFTVSVYRSGESNNGYDVDIYVDDCVVDVGDYVYPDITTSPSSGVTLRYSSSDSDIATINSQTGMIRGIEHGYATITVYAYKDGYIAGQETFSVRVYDDYYNGDYDEIDHINDMTHYVYVNADYDLPDYVEAIMKDGSYTDVEIYMWTPSTVDTSESDIYNYTGYVRGYNGTVKLKLVVRNR